MINRNLLIGAFSASILLLSCTEKEPLSTTGSGQTLLDTTYMASVESKDPRNVLVEEATGVKCPNCPAGALVLKQAEAANPGRVIVVALHAGSLTNPIEGLSKYDFRSDIAMNLFVTYFAGEPNKPAAVFDRTKQDGVYFVEARTKWLNIINQRLASTSPLNMDITSEYNTESDDYVITVTGAYTDAITKKQNLTIVITEDGIIDAQDDGPNVVEEYEHNHVLRDMLTDLTGNAVLQDLSSIEAGRVFKKSFRYKLPAGKDWKAENLHIVAFVHNTDGGDKEIMQAATVKLKD